MDAYNSDQTLVIGIAGGTGSGKSTVVRKIIESLPAEEVAVIPQDCYYNDNAHIPLEERLKMNYDEPASIEWTLLTKQIQELKEGKSIEMPTYDFITCSRLPETVHITPRKVIVVEGILVLTDKPLRDMLDVKVFVDADADERLIRVIHRDCIERGRTPQMVIDRYSETLKPMHELYIEPSKRYADLIIPQGGHNKVAVKLLTDYIRSLLPSFKQEK
ncbi:MAG: uridine kinase [Muribaculaceae bacterium]|nr:uridine kinase [Muribaculaceae bacterium]